MLAVTSAYWPGRSPPRTRVLERVDGGGGGVGASGWGAPSQHAWFWHLEPPALGLFHAVVVTTERREVAGACESTVVPGSGVVQVAAGGGLPAARRGAGGVAGGDQVAE